MSVPRDEAAPPTLQIEGLTKHFGGLRAVGNLDLTVHRGELAGLIGPNGAGKTTVFNMISGLYHPSAGDIRFQGVSTLGMEPFEVTQLGIGRTFQNIRLFPGMTVLENVVCASQLHRRSALAATLLSWPSFRRTESELVASAREQLGLFGLEERASAPASSLPYGDQRRLEIVRALALHPTLLLLDEPTAGMNTQESLRVLELIRRIREQYRLTIVLVEHNMPLVMRLCERLQVLNYGQIIAEGSPEKVRVDPRVVESYLGTENAEAAGS